MPEELEEVYPGFDEWAQRKGQSKTKKQPPKQEPKKQKGEAALGEMPAQGEFKRYISRFKDQDVEVALVTGDKPRGKLHTDNKNRYDVILETKDGDVLVFKHAIATIKVVSKAR